MRAKRRAFLWLLFVTLGWLVCRPRPAHALALDLNKAADAPSHYQSPEDLIDMVPVLNELPRNFIWGRGYHMKISGQSLRIDHQVNQTHETVKRSDCTIAFSYTMPVAGFFTSRIDMPIFYAQTSTFSQLSFNSLGDYATQFSKGAADARSLRLLISAKF